MASHLCPREFKLSLELDDARLRAYIYGHGVFRIYGHGVLRTGLK